MTNKLSLYFHIPFCVKKCDYCAFYSVSNSSDSKKQAYFEALLSQISLLKTDRIIQSVYFGGGTPPILGVDRLCQLIKQVKSSFTLANDCEITVEVNPKTVDFNDLKALKNSGANRLSVGIQSSDDEVLSAIGRIHSFSDAKKCISDARAVGFDNISADIIFALPHFSGGDSFQSFKKSLSDIMSTNPDHISAYSLQLEEGTPLFDRASAISFPDEDCEEAQYEHLYKMLTENGYEHYEISSFARDGKRSRHNLNYWACGKYFGFGAGAHSYYNGRRFSTKPCIDSFIENAPISLFNATDFDESQAITEQEIEEERIMLGLRTSEGVILPKEKLEIAQKIESLGLGTLKGNVLSLNSKGFRVSNSIIGMFF
ncbi:MAG: radical SAM family heme chaperone HemW [Clostridia bacterium]|nr:radical SAM family heme chaperone HemW [Clostridia bacterium]